MTIGRVCKRKVATVTRKATVFEAACLMRKHHVGDLVVVDETEQREFVPIGIVTDRDLVIEVMAAGLDTQGLLVEDVMSRHLVTVREQASINDVVRLMRRRGVRRIPVVSNAGGLVGITVLDDLLALLAGEMRTLARVMPHERATEARLRP